MITVANDRDFQRRASKTNFVNGVVLRENKVY